MKNDKMHCQPNCREKPLRWPVNWHRLSAFEKFFLDLPYFGLKHRVKRVLESQVKSRSCADFEKAWGGYGNLLRIRDSVFEIVGEYMSWNCLRFLPLDPCEIIFWRPDDDLHLAEAVANIERRFGVDRILDSIQGENLTFADLLVILEESDKR